MSCFAGQAARAVASGRKAAGAAGAEGFPLGPWDAGKPSKKSLVFSTIKYLPWMFKSINYEGSSFPFCKTSCFQYKASKDVRRWNIWWKSHFFSFIQSKEKNLFSINRYSVMVWCASDCSCWETASNCFLPATTNHLAASQKVPGHSLGDSISPWLFPSGRKEKGVQSRGYKDPFSSRPRNSPCPDWFANVGTSRETELCGPWSGSYRSVLKYHYREACAATVFVEHVV